MQHNHETLHISDDEDDLESLRLAALQSLKRPASTTTSEITLDGGNQPTIKKFAGIRNLNKRNRGFFGNARPLRNGSYNRKRNPNLISVPTLQTEQVSSTISKQIKNISDSTTVPKLILPQDRYCNKLDVGEDKCNEATSKFDRYNDSADSESDSEEECASSGDSPQKLERSGSLEVLMKELENELEGKKKIESKPRIKVKKIKESFEEFNTKTDLVRESVSVKVDVRRKTPPITNENLVLPDPLVTYPTRQLPVVYVEPTLPVIRPMPYTNTNNIPFDPYNRFPDIRSFEVLSSNSTRYERPHSPITIKTDILNTISAPLSPRSAAFVLQNREIIERRKKSPRRSYSRSPRPEFRRNLSPRYVSKSPSPVRNRRVSPMRNIRRLSPIVRLSSPNNARSPDRVLPVRSRRSPRRNNIRKRLGDLQGDISTEKKVLRESRSISLSLSPSPVRDTNVFSENQDSSSLDPVLEARKRKFEEKGSAIAEGIVRLKSKKEEDRDTFTRKAGDEAVTEDGDEDELLVEDSYEEFDKKIDLFSDDESNDENEGRFKLNSEQKSRNITMLPFTRLLNGTNTTARYNSTSCNTKKSYGRDREQRDKISSNRNEHRSDRNRGTRNRRIHDEFKEESSRGKSGEKVLEKIIQLPKDSSSSQISRKRDLKSTKNVASDVSTNTEQKKLPIEIKIRNPSKYEIGNKVSKDQRSCSRKVKIAKDSTKDEIEQFVEKQSRIVDKEEEEDDERFYMNDAGGDLRAQLSRKRAERQNKLPKVEEMPSRLLKSALQGVVFKKSKKSKKIKDEKAPLDGKLPIRLRLGVPGSPDAFNDSNGSKISRKRIKNRGILEQVLYLARLFKPLLNFN